MPRFFSHIRLHRFVVTKDLFYFFPVMCTNAWSHSNILNSERHAFGVISDKVTSFSRGNQETKIYWRSDLLPQCLVSSVKDSLSPHTIMAQEEIKEGNLFKVDKQVEWNGNSVVCASCE